MSATIHTRPMLHHQLRGRVTFIGTPIDSFFVCCAGSGVLALG